MQRYFVDKINDKEQFVITDADFFHLTKVIRANVGQRVYCVVNGKTAIAEISEIAEQQLLLQPIEWIAGSSELPVHVTLVCGLPKGDKIDLIVQKCTELGASQLIVWQAKRSVVKWDQTKAIKKIERLQKIAKEAAEQSHRVVIPEIHIVANLDELVELTGDFSAKIVAYEEAARQEEKSQLSNIFKKLTLGQKLVAVFGPEGGLTEVEVQQLTAGGFTCCGLGPRILRAETAPLFLMSAVSYQLELT